MKIIGIDQEKCNHCRKCIEECSMGFYKNEITADGKTVKISFSDPLSGCIRCGHCVAICPQGAIILETDEQPFEFEGVNDPQQIADYSTIMKILRARRSIRKFTKEPIPQKDVEEVLEACRYSPSAHNNQAWEYMVLTNPEKIAILREMTIDYTKSLYRMLLKAKVFRFILPKEIREEILKPALINGLKEFLDILATGDDRIFFNAPIIIICYTTSMGSTIMAGADVGIALTHAMLAAQAKGLGTCWIGFAQEALNSSKKNKKVFGIPKGKVVAGVLILGHPAVNFHRAPPRELLKVIWNPSLAT